MPAPAAGLATLLCRNDTWLESTSPSTFCRKLQNWMRLVTNRWLAGTWVHSSSGGGGTSSDGPRYAHSTPPRSCTGYAVVRTLDLKSDSGGSLGMSTQVPSVSNFQPWYTQRKPFSSLRPKNSDAPRCGQLWLTSPTRPLVSRNETRSSPSKRTRTGSESVVGSSDERANGCQNRLNRSPIGVPRPTRVSRS